MDQGLQTKQQILIIHGGDAFETHGEYIQSLKDKDISLERMKQKDWKTYLEHDLGDGYEVYAPKFPNAQNARYDEWKIIFEKILPLLNDNLILIGHSLGGIFLAKYLSEYTVTKPIKAVFLIAAPYSTKEHEPIVDFTLTGYFAPLSMTQDNIFLYHSTDDVVVPYENAEMFKKDLPDAKLRSFSDRGHFNSDSFPELIKDIQSL